MRTSRSRRNRIRIEPLRASVAALVSCLVAVLMLGLPGPASAAPTFERVSFSSGGATIVGHHYRGTGPSPRPVLVMAHGLGGTQAMTFPALAPRFAAAGYDVLTFDYRYWGESGGTPRNVIDIPSQLGDWRSAIAFARRLPGVAPDRVALWGTSLAGGHVLQLGSENLPGVRVVLSQVPHVSGPASTLAIPVGDLPWLAAQGLADLAATAQGKAPVYIPIAGAPGTRALLPQPSSLPGYHQVAGVTFDNRVAARLALQMPFYSPDTVADRSRAATFIAVGSTDELCPPEPAIALAKKMHATFKIYSGGHFDGYPGAPFGDQLFADQLAFLKAHLPVPTA